MIIGKKYMDTENKKVYMVVDKKTWEAVLYSYKDALLIYPKTGSNLQFIEYDEDFHKPFKEEVQVILYRGGEFIIDNGYDVSRLDENEARVFKAVLKEIM